MTHSFITRLSRNICLLALCLGQVLMTTPVMAATTAKAAQDGASKGTQSTIKEGIDYAGRGLGDVQTGVNAGAGAANDVLGAAGAFGVDTGGIGGQIGSITGGLGQGQNILNQAGKLAGTDFNGLVPSLGNGKFDFANMKDAFGSQLSGIGKTLGNKWDSVKGISMSGIWGDTTNFMKDLTPDIKGLTAEKLMEFDFSGLTTLFPEGGIPGILVDLEPVNIFTVISTEATFASKEAQLAYEQEYTPTIGPVGIMDGRMGICQVNGHDYTGMLRSFVAGPGSKNEGNFPYLHLDTVCILTVGIGTALHVAGNSKEAQKAYFMGMDYSPKEVQDSDFEAMWNQRNLCLLKCPNNGNKCINKSMVNKTERSYRQYTKGALTQSAVQDAVISELCKNVRSYDANIAKSGGNFSTYPLEHQFAVVDIGYQGGPGCITGCGECAMASGYSTPFKSALNQKNCSSAVSAFNGSNLARSFTNRAAERRGMIMAPCGGGGGK